LTTTLSQGELLDGTWFEPLDSESWQQQQHGVPLPWQQGISHRTAITDSRGEFLLADRQAQRTDGKPSQSESAAISHTLAPNVRPCRPAFINTKSLVLARTRGSLRRFYRATARILALLLLRMLPFPRLSLCEVTMAAVINGDRCQNDIGTAGMTASRTNGGRAGRALRTLGRSRVPTRNRPGSLSRRVSRRAASR
jgi:hypothetical protein